MIMKLLLILQISLYSLFSFGSDSGIKVGPYSEIEKEMYRISELFPSLVEVIHYGTVGKHKLSGLLISKDKNFKRFSFITGATHGNEFLNLAHRLSLELIHNKGTSLYLDAGGALIIVPVFNPYGYDKRQRHNSNKKDLNREFHTKKPLIEAEVSSFVQLLFNFAEGNSAQLDFSLDYHCCQDEGSLVYPEIMSQETLSNNSFVLSLAEEILDPTSIGTPMETVGYSPAGISMNYYYKNFDSFSVTYEGQHLKEDQKIKQHAQWIDSVLSVLSGMAL